MVKTPISNEHAIAERAVMKLPKTNQSGKLAGCLSFIVLFPICMTVSIWIAMAFGPMSCALGRCSRPEKTFKEVLSMLILFGGGVGIPIALASLVEKGVKTASTISSEKMPKSEKENKEIN